ncbi:hypothetical protein [Mesorhizobium sp. KR1-2]|uniref:hypothetical protein n=1 Tax=Mesorhizobium sp. KR1-2 TaxID=3156609 RepID=UPI0032B58E94
MTQRAQLSTDVLDGAALLRHDLVEDAAHNLVQIFAEMAPAEALTRALVSERSENRDMARLWVDVYLRCCR